MNSMISRLHPIQIRRLLTTVVLSLSLFLGTVWGVLGYAAEAQALPSTPEAKEYQVDTLDQHQIHPDQAPNSAGEAVSNFPKNLSNAVDTVREKLNLDEPLPESTKDFFKQVQGEEVEIEEPRPFGK